MQSPGDGNEKQNMTLLNERVVLRVSLLAILATVLWGGNAVSIKIGLDSVPPLAMAVLRFVLGGLVVLGWNMLTRVSLRIDRRELKGLLQLVLVFIAQIYLLNTGTQYTSAGHATVFISTYPFFTALFAHLLLAGDRLNAPTAVGMGLSFVGIVLIFGEGFFSGDFRSLPGDLMTLGSGVLLGLRLVYTKRLTQNMPPSKLLFWQAALSIPVFLSLSLLLESWVPSAVGLRTVGAILYQGLVIAGFCFLLWTSLLRRHAVSKLAVFGFLTPVSGVFLSGILLGEPLSLALVIGVLFVGGGIVFVNMRG